MEITTLMFVLLKNMRNFSKNTNYGLLKEKFVKSNNISPIFWQIFRHFLAHCGLEKRFLSFLLDNAKRNVTYILDPFSVKKEYFSDYLVMFAYQNR